MELVNENRCSFITKIKTNICCLRPIKVNVMLSMRRLATHVPIDVRHTDGRNQCDLHLLSPRHCVRELHYLGGTRKCKPGKRSTLIPRSGCISESDPLFNQAACETTLKLCIYLRLNQRSGIMWSLYYTSR